MITSADDFDLNVRWRFPGGRKYAFAFISLFVFLLVIYSNSFQGAMVFDDAPNIIENSNVHLTSLDWPEIKKTFYGIEGRKISRPVSYFTLALNYYFHGLSVFGYHVVNFIIHYLAAVFLFLFIYNTLKLPSLRERYGPEAYSIALLAVVFWATSPLQVTAVTYIVQRMASMAGMFYVMAMYFYLKGRMAERNRSRVVLWGLCLVSGVLAVGSKENAVLLPFSIWLFDLLLIQGASRENVIRNLKVFMPVAVVVGALGLWYVNIGAILSGAAYENRPFTPVERLLTQPRIIIFYISLLLYPLNFRMTLVHDIDLSTSLLTPWTTMPSIALILGLLACAVYLARRSPLTSFAIIFYFLNHAVESTFIPLELIYEHRNYIPSMFFFVPLAVATVSLLHYFSYKKRVQLVAVIVFTFIFLLQGHTVYERNADFSHPLLLWTDNSIKAPNLSRPHNNLGKAYWEMGRYEEAFHHFSTAVYLDRPNNYLNRAVFLHNLGHYYLVVKKDCTKAMGYFSQAMRSNPGYMPPHHDAVVCLIMMGDLIEAEVRIKSALRLWPNSALLRHNYSLVLLKLGKYKDALEQARQVLIIDRSHHVTMTVIAEALRQKGNDKLSTFYWERYAELFPDNPQANIALIDLYFHQNRKEDIPRIIGRLMILKGTKNWFEFINDYFVHEDLVAYSPDSPEDFIAILKERLVQDISR